MSTSQLERPVSYRYRAARPDGGIEVGSLGAASREAAAARLAARGVFPLEIWPDAPERGARPGMPVAELALGLRVLATLLESGLPISRVLSTFAELAPDGWRRALPAIRDAVREGQGLAGALRLSPVHIPDLVIGMVHAGEAGSGLASAVRRAADLTEQQAATRAALRAALTYPLILSTAGAASLALLVGVVLPRFAAILADLGQSLPATTRAVLAAGNGARAAAVPGVLAIFLSLALGRAWTGTARGRLAWHGLLHTLPLLGPVRRSAAVGRVCASLAALLESGVPIAPALLHAARVADDAVLTERLLRAREGVIGGQGVARSLDACGAATPAVVRLVRAGEESGRLVGMLAHAARMETERAEAAVRGAVRVLEPALILLFGGVIAFVSAALLQAVYAVRPA